MASVKRFPVKHPAAIAGALAISAGLNLHVENLLKGS
jgi:hypothetical protein